MHAHILPGIDDGSRDWDESRRMLEESYRQGIRYIVATPHYSRSGLPSGIYELAERFEGGGTQHCTGFYDRSGAGDLIIMRLGGPSQGGKALTLEGSQICAGGI